MLKKYLISLTACLMFISGVSNVYAFDDSNDTADPSDNIATEETDPEMSEATDGLPSEDEAQSESSEREEPLSGDPRRECLIISGDESIIRPEDHVLFRFDDIFVLDFYDGNQLSDAQRYYDATAEFAEPDTAFGIDADAVCPEDDKDPFEPVKHAREVRQNIEEAESQKNNKTEQNDVTLFIQGHACSESGDHYKKVVIHEHSEEQAEVPDETGTDSYFIEGDEFSVENILTYGEETTTLYTLAGLRYIKECIDENDIVVLNTAEPLASDLVANEIKELSKEHTVVIAGKALPDLEEEDNILFVESVKDEAEESEKTSDYAVAADDDIEASIIFGYVLARNGKDRIDEIERISGTIENDNYAVKPEEQNFGPAISASAESDADKKENQENAEPAIDVIKDKLMSKQNQLLKGGNGHELDGDDTIEGRGITDIERFDIEFVSGGSLEEYQGTPAYFWLASHSREGHSYIFRINYATSGVDKSLPGELEIRLPLHILKSREGDFADRFEMSIPSESEVSEDDVTTAYVYKIENDQIVVYNRLNISAAVDGYFEIAYQTKLQSFYYKDMQISEPMNATIKGKDLTETSNTLRVGINTTAELVSVSKNYPTLSKTWKSEWGLKPSGADDWLYLEWDIASYISPYTTQPYTLQFTDNLVSAVGYTKDYTSGDYTEVPIDLSDVEIVGFRERGTVSYRPMPGGIANTGKSTIDSARIDSVLTRHRKSTFEALDRYEITNSITDVLTPFDGIDDPTSAASSKRFLYERPEFKKPPGHFISWKRADGAFRRYNTSYDQTCIYNGTDNSLLYLGMRAGDYTRYDLDDFKSGNLEKLDGFDYAAWVLGYAWPWTLQDDADWRNPENYGIKPVHYELTDETFYLHEDGGEPSDRLLTSEDFQIDTLAVGLGIKHAEFSTEEQTFLPTDPNWSGSEIVKVYGKFSDSDEYVLVAERDMASDETTIDDTYISSVTDEASLINHGVSTRMFKLNMKDNCVGYRVETENSHFYTTLETVPTIHLKNSPYVMETISEMPSIAIENTSHSIVNHIDKDGNTEVLYEADDTDTDYAREIQKKSEIRKTVASTSNNRRNRTFTITWRISANESYLFGQGLTAYIPQETGVFYDLLPNGSVFDPASVRVLTENGYLPDQAFRVETIDNYKNTGRTLVTVRIDETFQTAVLYLGTVFDWDSITDFGKNVYNPVAYETGNESIKDGFPDDGGNLPDGTTTHGTPGVNDKALMSGLDPSVGPDDAKFIYEDEAYDISILTAANTGLTKKIKSYEDTKYSYETETTLNGLYSYRWRYQIPLKTKASNMVMFDSMENYGTPGLIGDDLVHEPDWKGTLRNVDTSQLVQAGIAPVVYYSSIPKLDLDIEENHDIDNASVWTEASEFLSDHSLSDVKAIAVDMRKGENGEDYILQPGKSITVVINMQAPNGATSDGTRIPETFNDIYMQNRVIDSYDNETDFYIRHDYTVIRLVVSNDVQLKKISSVDGSPIKGIKFRVTGTSAYGNDIDMISESGKSGSVLFKKLEQGQYILSEYETTPDWLINHTEHTLEITPVGDVLIDGEDYTDREFVVENDPRVHGDVTFFKKREASGTNIPEFMEDEWDPDTMYKYAVSVYGIGQDQDQNGEAMGMTFGPALGANYVQTFKSHTPSGSTGSGNPHHCVHDDSWDEICYWNQVDPYVYEQCIGECCTKSISLKIPEAIQRDNQSRRLVGDGPSVLYEELKENARRWNSYLSGSYTGNSYDNVEGWGGSNIRAVLNGVDTDASDGVISNTNTWASNEGITEKTALIAAFPEVLQEAIGQKAVRYVSNHNKSGGPATKTTYDKLWLLSIAEMGTESAFGDRSPEAIPGGTVYQRFSEIGAYASTSSQSPFKGYYYYINRNSGNTLRGWTRSTSDTASTPSAVYLDDTGRLISIDTYASFSFSPCFTLSKKSYSNKSSQAQTSTLSLIPNTTFQLTGTSDYGNDVNVYATSNALGFVNFQNIEKGKYELRETKPHDDFIKNETVWEVIVGDSGLVSVLEPEAESRKDRLYEVEINGNKKILYNEPRYWDFSFIKVDADNNSLWLEGAEFRLYGTSDLGTSYDMILNSTHSDMKEPGIVEAKHLEKGTYILEEITAPSGLTDEGLLGGNRNYVLDPTKHIVHIDHAGNVTITGAKANPNYNMLMLTNARALDGKITIIKHWVDSGDDSSRPIPELHLSTTDLYGN